MKFGVWALFDPPYFSFSEKTACWFGVYLSILYGPEPTTLSSASFLSAGKTFESTIAATLWVRMKGHVLSPFLRLNVTVVGSVASVDFSEPSSDDGPLGSAIFSMRSIENFTSADVISSPFENFCPGLSVQT